MDYYFIFCYQIEFVLQTKTQFRGTESEESLKVRIATAKEEIKFAEERPGFFDYDLIHEELPETMPILEDEVLAREITQHSMYLLNERNKT